ncbi:MAG: DNA polymerase III subunit psi [Colwellia sp.]|nr:DNA polymerase III subunit psi [Colwellia sp.]MCW8864558.1 DNA polymerase III subunit psi [Colwellia sp.]MCW9082206.1 DNA polymerase III subunit psi [Colwellia sp.]
MSITPKQFDQLSEMGISLWQSRTQQNIEATEQSDYQQQDQQSLANLCNEQLFSDILQCMDLTVGEVKAQGDHLNIGLFNWYFLNNSLNNETEKSSTNIKNSLIHCIDNKLVTPNVETLSQSATLKKQLWQAIARNL